jgi:hypothetical protein
MQEDDKEAGKCCICDKDYSHYGNNAQPIMEGRCCDDCNQTVIYARLLRMIKG